MDIEAEADRWHLVKLILSKYNEVLAQKALMANKEESPIK